MISISINYRTNNHTTNIRLPNWTLLHLPLLIPVFFNIPNQEKMVYSQYLILFRSFIIKLFVTRCLVPPEWVSLAQMSHIASLSLKPWLTRIFLGRSYYLLLRLIYTCDHKITYFESSFWNVSSLWQNKTFWIYFESSSSKFVLSPL